MLNLEAIESAVAEEQYHQFPGTTMTVCCLRLATSEGTVTVVGHADCINPKDFDVQKGREASRRHAIDEAFSVFGTHLKLGGTL